MSRPVVGIIGNYYLIGDDYPVHASGTMNALALRKVGVTPLIVPASPDLADVEELMQVCDGFMFTGGRPNVHPEEYGEEETEAHGTFDRDRDRISLPLIRACVAAGQPIFAVCRGFQELNVAMGGSLYPEIRDLPGRMNHRMPPDGTLEEKFALRHDVTFSEGGIFADILGSAKVRTNTLHGQGIKEKGARIVIDGRADDGTPEAIYVDGAPGFTLGVQWHPEYKSDENVVSKALFEAFGQACQDWASGNKPARLRSV